MTEIESYTIAVGLAVASAAAIFRDWHNAKSICKRRGHSRPNRISRLDRGSCSRCGKELHYDFQHDVWLEKKQ